MEVNNEDLINLPLSGTDAASFWNKRHEQMARPAGDSQNKKPENTKKFNLPKNSRTIPKG